MTLKKSVAELKEIMGSDEYSQRTQHAWVIGDFILGKEDEKEQRVLVKFLIKNQGKSDIPKTSQETIVPRIPSNRYSELLESMGESTTDFMKRIVDDGLSLDAAAEKIHQRLLELDDKEERAFFLTQIMFTGFCPYNFYKGKLKMTQEEYIEILDQSSDIIKKIEKVFNGKIRFHTKSAKGEYILTLLEGLDDKVKAILISRLIHTAQHNPCDCVMSAMALSLMLGGGRESSLITDIADIADALERSRGFGIEIIRI